MFLSCAFTGRCNRHYKSLQWMKVLKHSSLVLICLSTLIIFERQGLMTWRQQSCYRRKNKSKVSALCYQDTSESCLWTLRSFANQLLLLSLLNQFILSWESQGNHCRQNLQFKVVNQLQSSPEEPSDPEVPWKRFMIPQPRFPRQHFFNSILPQVYESAQPHLLVQFESYWIKERRDRWERKQLLDSLSFSDKNNWPVREKLHYSSEVIASSFQAAGCLNLCVC